MENKCEKPADGLTIRELLGLRNRLFDQEREDLQRSLEAMANSKGFSLRAGDLLVVPRCTDTRRMERLAPAGVNFSDYVKECFFLRTSSAIESPTLMSPELQFEEACKPHWTSPWFTSFIVSNPVPGSFGTLINTSGELGPSILLLASDYIDQELAAIAKSFRELPPRTKRIAERIILRECVSPTRAWYRAVGSPRGESRRAMKRFIRDLRRWERSRA